MTAIATGMPAPDFALQTDAGTTFRLSEMRGAPVVLYFYPQDDTEGCTIENQEFSALAPDFARLGVKLVGISPDSVSDHCKFRDKYKLTFPLLSDPDGKVLEAYGAWGDKVMYGKKMKGIIRSTVVIDKAGKIARHWPKVSVKGHVDEVVEAVKALK